MKPKPFYVYDSGLFNAVAENDSRAASLLLDKGTPVNAPNLPGFPPLLTAALFGRVELAELLLRRGADPNLPYEGTVTPLLCAVRSGNLDMVRLLLEQGADVSLRGSRGLSALYLTEACGFVEIADLIRRRNRS